MTETADVSVIMPAWRSAATIDRALASVAAQNLRPREVIVVDDGSDDGTAEIAEGCRAMLGDIVLIVARQPNRGAGAARNKALQLANGRWVAFLDADDEWLPDKLAASLARRRDGDVFTAHDMQVVHENGGETEVSCAHHFNRAADPFVALMVRGFVATSTVVAERRAVLAVGGFEESLTAAQDYDLWLRLAGAPAARFLVFTGAYTRYHISPGGITGNVERRRRCSLRVLARTAPLLAGRTRCPLAVAWLRVLVIHYEAATALCARRRVLAALLTLAWVPIALAATTVRWGGQRCLETRQSL